MTRPDLKITPRALVLPTIAAVIVAVVGLAFAKSQPMTMSQTTSKVDNAKTVAIKIKNYMYYPADVTVKVGTKVVVTNEDQTAHTLTAHTGAFDSGTIQPGGTMSFTVKTAGKFTFYCQFHAFMSGDLTVVK